MIHSVDAQKNLLPLVNGPCPRLKTNAIIVIDPGHGGKNPGAKSILSERYERAFTLDWATRIQKLLVTNGWRIYLTHTNDADVSLLERAAIADQLHADLFISLHFNSAYPMTDPSGVETYCLTPQGLPSSVTRDFEDDLSRSYPNNRFDAENLRYALVFHQAMLSATGANDRSVKRARYLSVLQPQNRPAILLEGGFLSNPKEARRIADPDFRQTLARAVAQALSQLGPPSPANHSVLDHTLDNPRLSGMPNSRETHLAGSDAAVLSTEFPP
jgi:N-acetylmuramoyl-L-alanine amidase